MMTKCRIRKLVDEKLKFLYGGFVLNDDEAKLRPQTKTWSKRTGWR